MDSIIVNFAPTGMVPTKKDTPYVPISAKEIIEDVKKAFQIGITSVHLHARDVLTEKACYQKEVFEEIILGIREFAPKLVIAVTTSGRMYSEFDKRTDVLDLTGKSKPDMGSLTLSSLNFYNRESINSPEMIKNICEKMNKNGIKPELEVFDFGMINYAKYLISKGILKEPYYVNFILGNIAGAQPNLTQIAAMLNEKPLNTVCSFGGIGKFQFLTNSLAIAIGCGARIGIEDNIWYDEQRTKLATNEDFLIRLHKIINAMEKRVCSSEELRDMLKLKAGNGEYGV